MVRSCSVSAFESRSGRLNASLEPDFPGLLLGKPRPQKGWSDRPLACKNPSPLTSGSDGPAGGWSFVMLQNEAEQPVRERILVVDDELLIRKLIATRLQWRGYDVTLASNGEEAVTSFQREPADLLVLDLMLPRLNGFEVLSQVRSRSGVPVLMLTACDRLEDRIIGLEMGADDYLVKPFSMAELEARVRSLLRRSRLAAHNQATGRSTAATQIEISGLTIHFGIRQVFRGLTRLSLTSMEFSVLELLVNQAGKPVSRMTIIESLWGCLPARHADTRIVDVHIARLRQKLEADPKNPELILTARGQGYQFQRFPEPAG